MKRRKLLAAVCALALSLSLTVPAFAEDKVLTGTTNSATITVTSTLNLPTFKVTIAPLAGMVINPYGMSYTGSGALAGVSGNDTLITAPALITNESDVDVTVTAKPYVSERKEVIVAGTKEAAESATDATIFMEFMFADAVTDKDTLASTGASWPTSGTALTDGEASARTATVDLTKAADASTPTYGAYKISGASGGTANWTASSKPEVTIVFDIAYKATA